MFRFPKRSRSVARIAVGLVALGAPLLGASAAQGAIGLTPQVTTNLPDIRSATILPTFNEVEICFDQAIDLGPNSGPGSIQVGGYVTGPVLGGLDISLGNPAITSGPATITSTNCVKAQFGGGIDLRSATYAHASPGLVKNLAAPGNNLADSAPLVGSEIHSGTRGDSTAPDLSIAAANLSGSTNQIGFQFDSLIDTSAGVCAQAPGTPAPGFGFYDQQGNVHTGLFLGCSNSSTGKGAVLIQFNLNTSPVNTARRAWALQDQVFSTGKTDVVGNPQFSVVVVGGSGSTSVLPDLLSVELANAAGTSNQLNFTFDSPVGNVDPTKWHAVLSDGTLLDATAFAVTGDVVRVTFGGRVVQGNALGAEQLTEFIVGGYMEQGGLVVGVPLPPAGLPAGDNAGAFSLGWTTGPDPISASRDIGAGQITIKMDQRMLTTVGAGPLHLVDTDGLTGSLCTATSLGLNTEPNQPNLVYQCGNAADVQAAAGVYLPGPQVGAQGQFGVLSNIGDPNADQTMGFSG